MGLIYCPDCGRSVSDNVNFCPNCSYPLSRLKNLTPTYTRSPNNNLLVIVGYICVVLTFFGFPVLFMITGIVIGIVNITKGSIGHGILQIILSLIFGVLGILLGILAFLL
jgi:hypothetical protein